MRGIDKEFQTGVILVDLKKAFGQTVFLVRSHCTFTKNGMYHGFKDTVIKWFQSYLSNRKFIVTLEDVFSDARLINRIVPQGFILVPLLFPIYINDLPHALNETESYIYADYTCIFYQGKDVDKIKKVLSKEFLSLSESFIDNKLTIHFGDDKTKTIFSSRKKIPPKLSMSCGDYSLKQHNTVEYLGCCLDSNLKRESMVREVLKMINTKINFL